VCGRVFRVFFSGARERLNGVSRPLPRMSPPPGIYWQSPGARRGRASARQIGRGAAVFPVFARQPRRPGLAERQGSHMAIQWFYQTGGGQQSGPVDSRELRRLAEAGVVRPDTLVRQGTSSRWVRAEQVRGLFQRSTPAPSPSVVASPPVPPPIPPPIPESGAPSRGVSGESSIRHGLGAAAVNGASEKPERVWPVTWAAIIVASATVLLLLWALVFRGGSAPQQQAEKDQPSLAVAQSAESGSHTPEQPVRPGPPPQVARTPAQPAEPKEIVLGDQGQQYSFSGKYYFYCIRYSRL